MTQTDIPATVLKPWLRDAPQNFLFINANVVDVVAGTVAENMYVMLRQGKIESVSATAPVDLAPPYKTVDFQGRYYLCPGLFDAHVHLCATPGVPDLAQLVSTPHDVSMLRQPYVAAMMLHRGFTSVRDCGGAHLALKEAIADGVVAGPRLFIAGHALSQTGGHGDHRTAHAPAPDSYDCCAGSELAAIVNGVPQCMAAVRDNIRRGADFIKIMGAGGVASLTDRLEHLQFTAAEIAAIADCARNAGRLVTAHTYTPAGILHCIENGVRGIEHGNFVDAPTARRMAELGVYLTPTLITYAEMGAARWQRFLPPALQAKNKQVLAAGLNALRVAADAGVTLCYGSDLLGPLVTAQSREFALRAQVLSPVEILRSATVNPAQMVGWGDRLGQVQAGFLADVLVLKANPLEDITVLDEPETGVLAVLKEGRVYMSQWSALPVDAAIPIR